MPELFTAGQLLEREFLATAEEPFPDIYMKFDVHFQNPGHMYRVTIQLYDCKTDNQAQWVEPEPHVQVTYFADEESKKDERVVPLKFDDEKTTASFEDDLVNWEWNDFLLIGMEFPQWTINYTLVSSKDEFEIGPPDELRVEEMRRVSLLSHKTYAPGDKQIWGKRYSGRGQSLVIENGHSLMS
ncbi:hypothetical protein EIK77_006741 [Talaromyces pinophilus]|nr:hypothetical protein EIK77_006741 [Talaromyces pinophilus]PCG89870.1 Hypothetical protein PENO1_102230 [Penicillium occitanis (nom. inval.)]PCG90476.1 hypothetical protein PENOC_101820 [Penicillium occitanis (nom. inval.)]